MRVIKGSGDPLIEKATRVLKHSAQNLYMAIADVYVPFPDLTIILCLLSGRRIGEVLSGQVRVQEGKTSMSVVFQENPATKPIGIPLLCPAKDFIEGIKALLKLQPDKMSRREVNQKYHNIIGNRLRETMSFVDSEYEINPNDLRFLYGFLAYEKYDYQAIGIEYREFLSWVFNMGDRLVTLPGNPITIGGKLKRIPASKRESPPKKWLLRVENRKK